MRCLVSTEGDEADDAAVFASVDDALDTPVLDFLVSVAAMSLSVDVDVDLAAVLFLVLVFALLLLVLANVALVLAAALDLADFVVAFAPDLAFFSS